MMSSCCGPAKPNCALDRRVQICSGHHVRAYFIRGAEAPSMPEGRAQRGRSRIRHAESIDGAEHRVKLSDVMAADH
jgi:hypothetical protein